MGDDVKLCAKARKTVVSCWLDISRIRVRVTRSVIHLQGTVVRMGEDRKDPEANAPFLEKLDDELRSLPGQRGVHYGFDNWRRDNGGGWQFVGKLPRNAKR